VNGKEVWEKRSETGLDLIWEPTFAAIARSADFGYTTGPAKWKANKKEEKFLGYGQFISIWKKQKDGSWKVALDCGIENPEPTGKPETLRMFVPEDGSKLRLPPAAARRCRYKKRTKNLWTPQKPTQPTPHWKSPLKSSAFIAKAVFQRSGRMPPPLYYEQRPVRSPSINWGVT
jgi:hypothetical protein